MTVFVIPVGPDSYELYYEHPSETVPIDEPTSTGIIATVQRKFADVLRAAETHHQRGTETRDATSSWIGRLQDRMLSWIAERIIEQRLLWNLRQQDRVVAVHAPEVSFDEVLVHIRRALQRDFERHRFWLVVDTIGLILSWPLTVIPGPNVLLFYFMFRVGGHWLSMRGASRGRKGVEWVNQPCELLAGLRAAMTAEGHERQRRVGEIASALHLQNLPAFVERQWAVGSRQ